jgi:hypothetical protein
VDPTEPPGAGETPDPPDDPADPSGRPDPQPADATSPPSGQTTGRFQISDRPQPPDVADPAGQEGNGRHPAAVTIPIVITKEHRLFIEFADAVRRDIGNHRNQNVLNGHLRETCAA